MTHVLSFEKPVVDLVSRVKELKELASEDAGIGAELTELEATTSRLAREVFQSLTPLQRVQLSRHPSRPYSLDYISRLITEWMELHGDRRFGEDAAIVGGLGTFAGRSVVIVGHQKGRNTKESVKRNFGMPNPEGYRKAIRLYELAERFRLPVLTFIDTPGAFPGIGAEERGQSEAIAAAIEVMSRLTVPVLCTVIGEGGSGGALALGVGNRVFVTEFGYYSVISPEGCAAILWKNPDMTGEAAARLRITAPDLLELGVVDGIIEEPLGGAHHDHDAAARILGERLALELDALSQLDGATLREQRYQRFRRIGAFTEQHAG